MYMRTSKSINLYLTSKTIKVRYLTFLNIQKLKNFNTLFNVFKIIKKLTMNETRDEILYCLYYTSIYICT